MHKQRSNATPSDNTTTRAMSLFRPPAAHVGPSPRLLARLGKGQALLGSRPPRQHPSARACRGWRRGCTLGVASVLADAEGLPMLGE